MDFLSNINVPFGVIFILAILWVIGIGVLIIRKNRLNPNSTHRSTRGFPSGLSYGSGRDPWGTPYNPFDSSLNRQLDLGPPIDDDFLDRVRDDEHHRNNH